MPSSLEVRLAHSNEADALAEVQITTWRSAYAHILPREFLASLCHATLTERFRELIEGETTAVWGAFLGGRAVGYAVLGEKHQPQHPGDFEIRALYVHPDAQSQGIGRALLYAGLKDAYAHGHRSAIVWAFSQNEPAKRFYTLLGGEWFAQSTFELGGMAYPDEGYLFPDLAALIERLHLKSPEASPNHAP